MWRLLLSPSKEKTIAVSNSYRHSGGDDAVGNGTRRHGDGE